MLVTTLAHAQKVCQWLASKDWCAFDTETVPNPVFPGETNALIWGRGKVVLWSLCYRGESYSFPTNFADPKYPTMSQWLTVFAPLFQGPTVKVMHNANYDLNILYTEGLPYIRPIWDTMIACWLANPAMEKGLKPRAALYGRFLRETSTVNFANLEELALYAEQDVVQTDELYQMQRFGKILRPEKIPSIAENGKVVTRLNDFKPLGVQKVPEEDLSDFERNFLILQELPVLRATLRAEQVGMPMSLPRFEAIRKRLLVDEESALKRFYAEAGCRPNLNSTKQLVELFQKKKIPLVEFSKKTKAPSLSAKALIKMSGSHPLVDQLLNYRKLVKLKSVYIGDGESSEGLNRFVHPDGRIHCSLATVGASTGRFCVTGDTVVETSCGPQTMLAIVLAHEAKVEVTAKTHKGNACAVVQAYRNGPQKVFELVTASGKRIRATAKHRFLTPAGWKQLAELSANDEICEWEGDNAEKLQESLCLERSGHPVA